MTVAENSPAPPSTRSFILCVLLHTLRATSALSFVSLLLLLISFLLIPFDWTTLYRASAAAVVAHNPEKCNRTTMYYLFTCCVPWTNLLGLFTEELLCIFTGRETRSRWQVEGHSHSLLLLLLIRCVWERSKYPLSLSFQTSEEKGLHKEWINS